MVVLEEGGKENLEDGQSILVREIVFFSQIKILIPFVDWFKSFFFFFHLGMILHNPVTADQFSVCVIRDGEKRSRVVFSLFHLLILIP